MHVVRTADRPHAVSTIPVELAGFNVPIQFETASHIDHEDNNIDHEDNTTMMFRTSHCSLYCESSMPDRAANYPDWGAKKCDAANSDE